MGKMPVKAERYVLPIMMLLVLTLPFTRADGSIDRDYRLAMEAFRDGRWNLADSLSTKALEDIESGEWNDWYYRSDNTPFMTYFTGEYVYLATSDKDQSWNLNKVEIHDPERDELVRVLDFTPWQIFGSTHSKNYTLTYLSRNDYIGHRIYYFETGRPENSKNILREGMESLACARIVDSDFVELIEKGRMGWSMSIFDIGADQITKIHDFTKIDINKSVLRQIRLIKNESEWNFIDGNKLYSIPVDTWEKKLVTTLPFEVTEFDNFDNSDGLKLSAIRNDTLYIFRRGGGASNEVRIVMLPSPLHINHNTKRFGISDSGEWLAQSDSDSLRIFMMDGTRAYRVHCGSSCLGGSFPLKTDTGFKGDTLIHYGNTGLKLFERDRLIYSLDADDTFMDYCCELEKLIIFVAPAEIRVLDINTLKNTLEKRYHMSQLGVFEIMKDRYLLINHIDGTSLLEIETGKEMLRTNEIASLSREMNQDTTKILLRGDNSLGAFKIDSPQMLRSDLIAVSASSRWAMKDTAAAIQNARKALAAGTSLSEGLHENLLEILTSLGLQKESRELIGSMAIKTGERSWEKRLLDAGAEMFIQPHLSEFSTIFAMDEGVFAFPVVIHPANIANGDKSKYFWFAKPGYEAEKRMMSLSGISIAEDYLFFFEYELGPEGMMVWKPLWLTESGEFKDLGPLLETTVEKSNPYNQYYADYAVDYWPLMAVSGDRVLTNFALNNNNIGNVTFTIGIDMTGEGNNWLDSTTVDPIRVGNRFYAHKRYGDILGTIAEGSQADSIGIRKGDIVIRLGDYDQSTTMWINKIKEFYPDRAPLDFVVLREGDTLSFTILNGRIGYDGYNCYNLVEIDPETGKHISEIGLPPGYRTKSSNSSGELVCTFNDTILFFDPVSGRGKKVTVKDLTDSERLYEIPHKDILLMLKPMLAVAIAIDISKTADDQDRVLWRQTYENIYRLQNSPRFCISDDYYNLAVILEDGTLLIIDASNGSVLSREYLPFHNFGFLPQINKGVLYGTAGSSIFGWKVAFYHPPFPWKYTGYGALALIPLFFVSLLVYRIRIENLKKKQSAELEKAEIDAEISAAKRLQAGLIPTGLHRLGDFQLMGKFIPASMVGGDYFDFRLLDDGRLVVVMGDVSGHGLPAGILVSMAKASLMTVHRSSGTDFKDTLASLNTVIRTGTPGEEMFMTLCYMVIDPGENMIGCSANGHPFPFIAKKDGTVKEIGTDGGYPLGVRDDQEFHITKAEFVPGDTVLLYTDGLPEQMNIDDEPLGYDRFNAAFRELSKLDDIESVVNGILERVLHHTGMAQRADDMAVVAIRYDQ